MKRVSRRHFLNAGAATVALPWILPGSVLGAEAPSKKITIGFIGTGDHGTTWNLHRYLELRAAKVLAVCDVDGARMRRAKAMVDAAYDTEDCATTKDFREVIARKDRILAIGCPAFAISPISPSNAATNSNGIRRPNASKMTSQPTRCFQGQCAAPGRLEA